ncbi:S-methyl-5'-thioadenosine phosphorylase [Phycisphaerales bacterium AB-hyl4]|uniref:Purine nucleoside phosphorylase n=1 Tax=Natronomicrosphaera hydrolytica TaxID=3242702 RepID=A0ABV4U0W4_9BACT
MTDTPLRIGIIGGTGLGDALGAEAGETRELDTPFGKPSSPITLTQWHGVEIAILQRHGPGHVFNPTHVPYRANIHALKSLGVTHVLASGATGSLQEHIQPGQLVIADQVIDRTHRRAKTFYEHAAVHVEFSEPFCPVMRQWLLAAAKRLDSDVKVHDGGTYVCMEGPAFSTKAESHMHRQMGGDLIGMTCMPEAKLAREAELAYALIAMPTDYDCWRPHTSDQPVQALLEEIMGNLKRATTANISLMKAALSDVTLLSQQPSPAHDALKLAIWSDKSKLDPAEVERLSVLWGRYFEQAEVG